jgi:hypothetical protein
MADFHAFSGLVHLLHNPRAGGSKKMKKILAGLVLAGGTMFAGPHISVGVGLGVPVAPAYVAPAPAYVDPYAVPPMPGPGYDWVGGYYYFSGGQRLWHAGYWRAPVVHEGVHGGYAHGFRR